MFLLIRLIKMKEYPCHILFLVASNSFIPQLFFHRAALHILCPSPGYLFSSLWPPPCSLALYCADQCSCFGLILPPAFSFWACPSSAKPHILHHKCSSTWAGKDTLCEWERWNRGESRKHTPLKLLVIAHGRVLITRNE